MVRWMEMKVYKKGLKYGRSSRIARMSSSRNVVWVFVFRDLWLMVISGYQLQSQDVWVLARRSITQQYCTPHCNLTDDDD